MGQPKIFSRETLLAHLRLPLFRNGYLLMLSSIAMSGISMVYWALAARLYTPEAVGLNSAVISAMVFVAGVSHLELGSALVRFVPRAGRATRRFVSYAYLATVIMTAAACVVAVLGLGVWFPVLGTMGGSVTWGVWFIVATVAWSVFGLQDDVLTGLRRTVWVPVENTVFAVAKIALLLLLAASFPRYGIFAAWTLPVVVAILPVSVLIFRYLIPRHARLTREQEIPLIPKQIVRYSA
jgi:O-antigen/teichoic acid export membrane protein